VRFIKTTSDTAFDTGLLPHDLNFVYVVGWHVTDQALRDILNSFKYLRSVALLADMISFGVGKNTLSPPYSKPPSKRGWFQLSKCPTIGLLRQGIG
jgi:hypothetical protein